MSKETAVRKVRHDPGYSQTEGFAGRPDDVCPCCNYGMYLINPEKGFMSNTNIFKI